ncbi:MAG: UDP-N-acetylglucosamine 2-epimerase (non-hydrolyzing) [Planctomycetaceae bacterium]|nr:UDP-N-acetylglucosamine 2-epimerase (non-hydrolyzing) [Planctomycetaceae bacterium]
MKRVALVFGTRPEAIKLAPLVRALERHPGLEPHICLTAQHREMVDQVLTLFNLQPTIDLDLMQPGQTLSDLTGRMVQRLGPALEQIRPDAVVVQGDTTSTLCGALAAFYQRTPVGHVEAGLRTGDLQSPFPEEMNRVMTTRMASWHFAATEANRDNLLAEGVARDRIFVTGNTVIDALFLVREQIDQGAAGTETAALLERFERPFVLITGHRRESFGGGFERICAAIRRLAQVHHHVDFVYPVHLNPNVQRPVREQLEDLPNVHLLPPLGYEPFVALMCRAKLILTDSGGVQEEAPALGKPTLVMRDKTERTEGLGGGVTLVGTETARIVAGVDRLLLDDAEYARMASARSPYGDGTASRQIVDCLARELGVAAGNRPQRAASELSPAQAEQPHRRPHAA